jgi:hypothetical protein
VTAVTVPWNTETDTPYVPSARQLLFHTCPAKNVIAGEALGVRVA